MRTELRFVDDNGKTFWIEVEGDIITLVIDEQGVPITARLDTGLARRFRRELSTAIAHAYVNRTS
jgi:hypothetical protein